MSNGYYFLLNKSPKVVVLEGYFFVRGMKQFDAGIVVKLSLFLNTFHLIMGGGKYSSDTFDDYYNRYINGIISQSAV